MRNGKQNYLVMLVVDESKEIFNEKRLLKEKKKNPYSDYFFSNESVLPSIQRHRTPGTKAGTRGACEQQKALNGKLDAFNITSSFFFCGLSKYKLRRTGRKTMCYHKKARNTNNDVLEPELSHAFSKWIFCWKAMNCSYKNGEVKAWEKVDPMSFFFPSSLYEICLLHWKNRGINHGVIKFSNQLFSQFLLWSLSGVKNSKMQGWTTVSENKMVYFF